MPDSAVLTFADPDAYHASIRRTQVVEGVVTARGEYRSELTRTDLHRLWMQRGDENLARVLNFAPSGERVPILFATDQRQAAMHFSGLELLGHVLQKYPETPVIIISGISDQDHGRLRTARTWPPAILLTERMSPGLKETTHASLGACTSDVEDQYESKKAPNTELIAGLTRPLSTTL